MASDLLYRLRKMEPLIALSSHPEGTGRGGGGEGLNFCTRGTPPRGDTMEGLDEL